jgi:hypothetical protein
MIKFASTSGAYKIYREGTYPRCQVWVQPNHAGDNVRFELQVYRVGAWRGADTGSFKLNSKSTVTVVIGIKTGVNGRIRATLPGHYDHLGDTSPWLYFRVV